MACGHEDGNDAARLADDPMHKLAVGRDPLTGASLASQPTLSRSENAVGPRALYRMGCRLAEQVIEAQRITIDLNPTDEPTHGQQEFTFFKGHDDTWSYLPLGIEARCPDESGWRHRPFVACRSFYSAGPCLTPLASHRNGTEDILHKAPSPFGITVIS